MIGRIFWLDINTKQLHIRSLTQNVRFIHSTKIMDVKKLHEDLRCSVCTNTYTDPKQLPCLHCFCLQCLNDIQRQSNDCDSITCPECRLEFSVPSRGNLSDFPSNIRVSNMLNVLAIKERNTSEVKCGNCDEKSSQCFYCFHCCIFWCEECVIAHSTIRNNKGHRVLLVNDFRDHDFEEISKRPVKLEFCSKKDHEKEELRFFCRDCERAICNICVVTVHNRHTKMLLEDVLTEKRAEIISLINSKRKSIEKKHGQINELQVKYTELQNKVSNVKRDARSLADNIIAVIEAKMREMFEDVDKQAEEILDFFKNQQICLEKQVQSMEKEIEEIEEFVKGSTRAELLRYKSKLEKSLHVSAPEIGDCNDLRKNCHLILKQNDASMKALQAHGIGSMKAFLTLTSYSKSSADVKGMREAIVGLEARAVLTTKNAEGEKCYTEHDEISVRVTNWDGHVIVTTAQVQDNRDGTYFITHFFTETGKHEISVTINEEHVCGSPFAVVVKPRSFVPLSTFGEQRMHAGSLSKPWGIAVSARNEIAVTESNANRVQVFSCNGTYLRSFGRKGNQKGEFYYPTGIAFDNSGNILVADTFNHRIQLLCDRGKYLSQFGGEGSLDHQLKYPYGLFVDSVGNIIVADSGNKLVKFFSNTGSCLKKIGETFCLTKPLNCIQHDDLFLISDISEHCIVVFDRKGQFQYKIGKKGQGDGEFNEPTYVSVYKPGELIICDSLNHRVQIIKLNGTFVSKFGGKGHKVGELKRPTSSAVLRDNKIVLTDCFNDRIQIFSE